MGSKKATRTVRNEGVWGTVYRISLYTHLSMYAKLKAFEFQIYLGVPSLKCPEYHIRIQWLFRFVKTFLITNTLAKFCAFFIWNGKEFSWLLTSRLPEFRFQIPKESRGGVGGRRGLSSILSGLLQALPVFSSLLNHNINQDVSHFIRKHIFYKMTLIKLSSITRSSNTGTYTFWKI